MQGGCSPVLLQLETESQQKDSNPQDCLSVNYSKCIFWGHSIITLSQNDQNLDSPLHLFVLVQF